MVKMGFEKNSERNKDLILTFNVDKMNK